MRINNTFDIDNYSYYITLGKKNLWDFSFKETKDKHYELKYKLYFENINKIFTDEDNVLIWVNITRVMRTLYKFLDIQPLDKNIGYDNELSVIIKGWDVRHSKQKFKNLFDSLNVCMEKLLKKLEKVLTYKNINDIINYYKELDDNEYVIAYDKSNGDIIELNSHIEEQSEKSITVGVSKELLNKINKMNKISIIHNHKKSLVFSEKDIEAYDILRRYINKKFDFMIYSKEQKAIIDYDTKTVYYL